MSTPADAPLCLLSVHAHPDDEASKGAGTVAKYAAEGIRGVLVCCTGGEEGDILNPAVDTPEVRERLVRIIRAERPHVIITYGDDSKFYPHPDHVRVHEISGPAFDAAGDPDRFPGGGEPWQPSKMYYTGWSARRVRALHEEFLARGEESPYASWFEERGFDESLDERFTTFVDVSDFLANRRAALLAHRTQVDPTGFWMRLPDDVLRRVF